jgi:hypothetical protein
MKEKNSNPGGGGGVVQVRVQKSVELLTSKLRNFSHLHSTEFNLCLVADLTQETTENHH